MLGRLGARKEVEGRRPPLVFPMVNLLLLMDLGLQRGRMIWDRFGIWDLNI